MDAARLISFLWLVHAAFAAVFVIPIAYFGRQRVTWHKWELAALFIPFFLWVSLLTTDWMPKSLSNIGEIAIISVAVPIAAILRLIIGKRFSEDKAAAWLLFLLCANAIGTYLLTPALPE